MSAASEITERLRRATHSVMSDIQFTIFSWRRFLIKTLKASQDLMQLVIKINTLGEQHYIVVDFVFCFYFLLANLF